MHEFSICQALLQQLEELVARHGAQGVRRVTVQVGPLSGVEPDLLSVAFAVARLRSCAESAELVLESLPLRIRCLDCAEQAEAAQDRLCCPACGSPRTQLVSGDELLLRQVELSIAPESSDAPELFKSTEEASACVSAVGVQ